VGEDEEEEIGDVVESEESVLGEQGEYTADVSE